MNNNALAPIPMNERAVADAGDHLSLNRVTSHVHLVAQILEQVMKEGTHYGASFPGDSKKNLLLPGAQKLCVAFGLVPRYRITKTELPNGHREIEVVTELTTRSGAYVGEGIGSCSTMESKYRWRNAALKCPSCGKETIIKGKAEYGGGWVCFAKKGGCNAKFQEGDRGVEDQPRGKIENPDVADVYNTVLKIACKRSLVHGTITVTGAGDIFAQDADDFAPAAPEPKPDSGVHEAVREQPSAAKAKPAPAAQAPVRHDPPELIEAYKELQGLIPKECAQSIWSAYGQGDRLAGIQSFIDDIRQIQTVVGDAPGLKLVGEVIQRNGGPKLDAAGVRDLADAINKTANGEVESEV